MSPTSTSPLDRLAPRTQLVLVVALAVLACGWGVGMLVLQHRLVDMELAGRSFGGLASLFAGGSSRGTAWPGWAAAFFFVAAVLRIARGRPEPPAGRPRGGGEWTVSGMRAALRREYRLVRVALGAVDLLAMFDLGRAAVYVVASLTGDALARSDVVTVCVEAAGLVAAAVALTAWVLIFRRQLETWGAL